MGLRVINPIRKIDSIIFNIKVHIMKIRILGLTIVVASAAAYLYNQFVTCTIETATLANIEALASGETIEGEVCFYKGNSVYETRIPCEADYPNIGPCGERVAGFYSTDRAQCYK